MACTFSEYLDNAKSTIMGWFDTFWINDKLIQTYYIDAINGDDNNSGDFNSPLKTIGRAVNKAPIRSRTRILLFGSDDIDNPVVYDFGESPLSVYYKDIFFDRAVAGTFSRIKPTFGANNINGMRLYSSHIDVYTRDDGVTIEGADKDDCTSWIDVAVFNMHEGVCSVSIGGFPYAVNGIQCLAGQSSIINVVIRDTRLTSANILLRHIYVTQDTSSTNKIIKLYQGTTAHIDMTIVLPRDKDNNVIDFKDIVQGVQPNQRNILSNIDLI